MTADEKTAIDERLALALRAIAAGELEDAAEWVKRAKNHLRFTTTAAS